MKWFQVDTDFPHDPKIRAVNRELGVQGIGGLVQVWAFVGRHGAQPGRAVDSAGARLPLEDLRDASQLDEAQFTQLVEICVRTGHFKPVEWRDHQGISIPAMERRADTYAKRQAQLRQRDFTW